MLIFHSFDSTIFAHGNSLKHGVHVGFGCGGQQFCAYFIQIYLNIHLYLYNIILKLMSRRCAIKCRLLWQLIIYIMAACIQMEAEISIIRFKITGIHQCVKLTFVHKVTNFVCQISSIKHTSCFVQFLVKKVCLIVQRSANYNLLANPSSR